MYKYVRQGKTAAHGETAFLLNTEAFRDLKKRVRKVFLCIYWCIYMCVCVKNKSQKIQ